MSIMDVQKAIRHFEILGRLFDREQRIKKIMVEWDVVERLSDKAIIEETRVPF